MSKKLEIQLEATCQVLLYLKEILKEKYPEAYQHALELIQTDRLEENPTVDPEVLAEAKRVLGILQQTSK